MVKNSWANKNVSFLLFFIFLYLHFFLVKRRKTFFGFGFQILFFGLVILFFGFGFWLSVRNGLYFVFGFGFLYILFYISYTPLFIRSSPFLFGPLILFGLPLFIWHPPLVSPFYLVIKDQFIFICHPFAPATAAPLLPSSRPR